MGNVMLTGGNTMFEGLPQMLYKKLKSVRILLGWLAIYESRAVTHPARACRSARRGPRRSRSWPQKTARSLRGSAVRHARLLAKPRSAITRL